MTQRAWLSGLAPVVQLCSKEQTTYCHSVLEQACDCSQSTSGSSAFVWSMFPQTSFAWSDTFWVAACIFGNPVNSLLCLPRLHHFLARSRSGVGLSFPILGLEIAIFTFKKESKQPRGEGRSSERKVFMQRSATSCRPLARKMFFSACDSDRQRRKAFCKCLTTV